MARPRLGTELAIRFHIVLTPELLCRIDDFRFANRVATRAKAARVLMEASLMAFEKQHVAELGPIDIETLSSIVPGLFFETA